MKHRFTMLLGVAVAALAISGSALAFDCMRVSSSLQGLQQSTKSGNWLFFDMSDTGHGIAMILAHDGIPATPAQIACLQAAYDASSGPTYFALGIGVAGANGAGNGPGVLAHNAPDEVLTNGTGIDHFDDTVLPVLLAAAPGCGVAP